MDIRIKMIRGFCSDWKVDSGVLRVLGCVCSGTSGTWRGIARWILRYRSWRCEFAIFSKLGMDFEVL